MVGPVGFKSAALRALVLMLTLAPIVRAGQVVVQNDSVVEFEFATIVAGFINGEEGGSWLTSSCDGAITEVQILWLAGDPGAQPYLANNVWIRDAGAFPNPGPVLLQLEGPLLTPGFLNQFIYSDEAQTIPINIPVSTGQTFVVTLEFSELALPLTGSIVRDNDGCQTGKNVLFAPGLGGWLDFCAFPILLQGDLVIRAVVDCAGAAGACCLFTGGCNDGVEPATCAGIGGVYQGDNTVCNQLQCPVFDQACCFMPTGCIDFNPDDCTAAGGFPQGPGSTCDIIDCFPIGACCDPLGGCTEVSDADCDIAGGLYLGADTTCAGSVCPQPEGACCLTNGLCFVLEEADCMVIPGSEWSGAFTDCFDSDENGTADACETGCAAVSQDADHDCDVDLGDYDAFVACVTGQAGTADGACVCFDADTDGDVDLRDYGAFSLAFTGPGFGCP